MSAAARKLFDDRHRAPAQRVLKELARRSDGVGISRSMHTVLWFSVLRAWSRASQSELASAINALKHRGQPVTVEAVEAAISEARQSHSSDESLNARKWILFVPFPEALERGLSLPMDFQVLGVRFELVDWDAAEAAMPTGESVPTLQSLVATRTRMSLPKPRHALRTVASSARHTRAWETVQPAFDTLRGLIEFEFGQHREHMDRADAPVHISPHPRWLAALSNGIAPVVDRFRGVGGRSSEPIPMTRNFLAKIAHDAAVVGDEQDPASSRALLAAVLRLYAQVRDEDADYRVLLGYWQIAENIVYPLEGKRSGETRQVARRFASIQALGSTDLTGLDDALAAIGEKRNQIVHRGTYFIADLDDINLLKTCAEAAIRWLRKVVARLHTRHAIDEYFSLRSKNARDLDSTREALAFIRNNQRQRQRKQQRVQR